MTSFIYMIKLFSFAQFSVYDCSHPALFAFVFTLGQLVTFIGKKLMRVPVVGYSWTRLNKGQVKNEIGSKIIEA